MGGMFCSFFFFFLESFLHFLVTCEGAGRCRGLCPLLSWGGLMFLEEKPPAVTGGRRLERFACF